MAAALQRRQLGSAGPRAFSEHSATVFDRVAAIGDGMPQFAPRRPGERDKRGPEDSLSTSLGIAAADSTKARPCWCTE